MRFLTFIAIDGRTNKIIIKVNTSVSTMILNRDCGLSNFVQITYFSRKVRISIRDWTFFQAVFAFYCVTQKTAYFKRNIRFGRNLRDQGLDNLSLSNIQSSLLLHRTYILSLFKKSGLVYSKF